MTDIFYEDIQTSALDRVALMPGITIDCLIRDLYGPRPGWRERAVRAGVWDLISEGKLVIMHPGNGVYLNA